MPVVPVRFSVFLREVGSGLGICFLTAVGRSIRTNRFLAGPKHRVEEDGSLSNESKEM